VVVVVIRREIVAIRCVRIVVFLCERWCFCVRSGAPKVNRLFLETTELGTDKVFGWSITYQSYFRKIGGSEIGTFWFVPRTYTDVSMNIQIYVFIKSLYTNSILARSGDCACFRKESCHCRHHHKQNKMDESDVAHAINALKKQKEEKRRKVRAKEVRKDLISGADAKEKNGGRLPHQEMSEVLQGLRDNGANTTRNTLNHLLKRYVRPARGREDLYSPHYP
jgi:hypothetical protein